MNIRSRFISLLWSVEYLSLWEAESPTFFKLCIFRLKNIFKMVIRSRRPNRFAHLLKSFTLRKADRYQRVPHGVCRLFLTYEPKELRSILKCIYTMTKSYSRVEFCFVKASSWHDLSRISLINGARVSFLEVPNASTNFVIHFRICALWHIAWHQVVSISLVFFR